MIGLICRLNIIAIFAGLHGCNSGSKDTSSIETSISTDSATTGNASVLETYIRVVPSTFDAPALSLDNAFSDFIKSTKMSKLKVNIYSVGLCRVEKGKEQCSSIYVNSKITDYSNYRQQDADANDIDFVDFMSRGNRFIQKLDFPSVGIGSYTHFKITHVQPVKVLAEAELNDSGKTKLVTKAGTYVNTEGVQNTDNVTFAPTLRSGVAEESTFMIDNYEAFFQMPVPVQFTSEDFKAQKSISLVLLFMPDGLVGGHYGSPPIGSLQEGTVGSPSGYSFSFPGIDWAVVVLRDREELYRDRYKIKFEKGMKSKDPFSGQLSTNSLTSSFALSLDVFYRLYPKKGEDGIEVMATSDIIAAISSVESSDTTSLPNKLPAIQKIVKLAADRESYNFYTAKSRLEIDSMPLAWSFTKPSDVSDVFEVKFYCESQFVLEKICINPADDSVYKGNIFEGTLTVEKLKQKISYY